jgi:hypothetical protein
LKKKIRLQKVKAMQLQKRKHNKKLIGLEKKVILKFKYHNISQEKIEK